MTAPNRNVASPGGRLGVRHRRAHTDYVTAALEARALGKADSRSLQCPSVTVPAVVTPHRLQAAFASSADAMVVRMKWLSKLLRRPEESQEDAAARGGQVLGEQADVAEAESSAARDFIIGASRSERRQEQPTR
jgi:hypothetical protein